MTAFGPELPRYAELAPGVRRLLAPNPSMMTGPGTNTYLFGVAEIAVIDPGPEIDAHIDRIIETADAPVRWEETIRRMRADGFETFIEVGTGNVLSGLVRRIDRDLEVGQIAETYERYPDIGPLLPAMGYGDTQVSELQQTINAVDCDLVLIGTPIDLERLLEIDNIKSELYLNDALIERSQIKLPSHLASKGKVYE